MTVSRTSRSAAATPAEPSQRSNSRPARSLAAPALAVGLGTALALGLGACSAGQITQTASQVAAVPGANVTVGDIALRNLLISYNGPTGYPAGSTVPLEVRIFNTGRSTVRLVGASANGTAASVTLVSAAATPSPMPSPSATPSATAEASPSAPASTPNATPSPAPAGPVGQTQFSIEVPAQSYVLLVPGAGPFLQLNGLVTPLTPGMSAPVRFTFDNGTVADVRIPFAPAPAARREGSVVEGGHE